MRIRIIPTNSRGCCAVPRTPASPTIPMANPAAKPLRPTLRPAPKCVKLLQNYRYQIEELPNNMTIEIQYVYHCTNSLRLLIIVKSQFTKKIKFQ